MYTYTFIVYENKETKTTGQKYIQINKDINYVHTKKECLYHAMSFFLIVLLLALSVSLLFRDF